MQTIGEITRSMAVRAPQSGPGQFPARSFVPSGVPINYAPETAALCSSDCPVCHGLAYVRLDVPITDPRFGKLQPCPESDPFKRYGGIIGLVPDEHNLSWNEVIDQDDVMRAVCAVRETIEQGYGWVFLHGGYGLGKSLVLKIAVAEFMRASRQPASYVRMAEVIEHMRGAYDARNPSEESGYRLDMWTELPFLAIDEFDRVRKTEFANEKQFVLMDRRYDAACRRMPSITIMASNCHPNELDGYLTDRIFDGRFRVVQLTGQSARPMMSYQG